MRKLTVAIDFDNTLIERVVFPQIKGYKLKPNARQVINDLSNKVEFKLNTARYGWYRLPAIFFIKKNKLPIKTYLFNCKVIADYYIDDRNIECDGIDWLKIKKQILLKVEKNTKK